jgi:uncharacterized protein
MIRIGLLSDTHGYLHPSLWDFFSPCDEIWHAGDIGAIDVADRLSAFRKLRAVYGNIDGTEARSMFPEFQVFTVEGVKVVMTHIGGYPGRYEKKALDRIRVEKPGLFISGHSHILKVIYDKKHQLLHINPGASGKSGLHTLITCVRFTIEGNNMRDLEVFEAERKI